MSLQLAETSVIKNQLVEMTLRLEKQVQEQLAVDHNDGELERGGNDRGEEANQALQISMDVEQTSRTAYTLRLVREALARLESNEFGLCLDCGEEIQAQRLIANPIAKRCIDCQSEHEDDQNERDSTPSI